MISLSEPVLGSAEKKALCDVIDSGWLTMGDRVAKFECAFAELHHVENAVAVNSCTSGLHLCLQALGIMEGDEVLVPSLSFVATSNVILYLKAKPIFVDIVGPERPLISLDDAKNKCTSKTKAVIIMHYGGYSVDLQSWYSFAKKRNIALVEDAAHCPGLRGVGKRSDAAVFSFFANKNMTSAEGGMIIVRDSKLAENIRKLRTHGMSTVTLDRHRGHAYSYDVTMLGYNYRLDELRAAIGLSQLDRLLGWNSKRRELTKIYRRLIEEQVPNIRVPFEPGHASSAHLMPILLPPEADKELLMRILRKDGIQTSIHYPPIHKFTLYQKLFPGVRLQETERFSERELTLPLHPQLNESEIKHIVDRLSNIL